MTEVKVGMKTKHITNSRNEMLRAASAKLGITMDTALEHSIDLFCTGALLVNNDSAPQPSDLEIVQKALEQSKSMIRLYPDGSGTLVSQNDDGRAVFILSNVLTWAKTTIGAE